MEKLFVVVRADLPPAQQAVQAIHAARQFAAEHPEQELSWFTGSNHLALLSVESEEDILRLASLASGRSIRLSVFREPDLGNSITAVALEPKAKALCRAIPLALGGR